MNRHLFRTLQLLSAFFTFLIVFPVEALLLQLPPRIFRADWGVLSARDGLAGFAALFAISLAGRGFAYLLDQKCGLPPLRRRLVTALPVLVLAGGGAWALAHVLPLYESMVWAVLGGASFAMGSALRAYRYDDLIGFRLYIAIAGSYLAALLIFALAKTNTLTAWPFAALLLAGTVILLVGLNQANLDAMMQRRRHRTDQLPQKIRSYNLRLVGGIAAALAAIPVLYRPVAAGIRALGRGARAVLGALLRLIQRLLAGGSDEIVPDIPASSAPVETPMEPMEPGVASPFWDYFGYLVLALLVIYILYNGKRIVRFVSKLCKKIWTALVEWLSRTRTIAVPDGDEAYVDTDEALPDAPDAAPEAPTAWTQWRRRYRRYRTMAAGGARLRAGYRLAAQWYAMQGVAVSPADTPLEQAAKARDALDFADPAAATDEYDGAHYGERPIPADKTALDALLAEMARTKTPLRYSNLTRPRKENSR